MHGHPIGCIRSELRNLELGRHEISFRQGMYQGVAVVVRVETVEGFLDIPNRVKPGGCEERFEIR